MGSSADKADKELARKRLVQAVVAAGFPQEFGVVLADYLGGPATINRMTSYIVQAHPKSADEIADKAVTLVEQRARWVEHKRSEQANAAYTRWLNRPRDSEDNEGDNEDEAEG